MSLLRLKICQELVIFLVCCIITGCGRVAAYVSLSLTRTSIRFVPCMHVRHRNGMSILIQNYLSPMACIYRTRHPAREMRRSNGFLTLNHTLRIKNLADCHTFSRVRCRSFRAGISKSLNLQPWLRCCYATNTHHMLTCVEFN